jgi:hypothetical protein
VNCATEVTAMGDQWVGITTVRYRVMFKSLKHETAGARRKRTLSFEARGEGHLPESVDQCLAEGRPACFEIDDSR